VILLQKGMAIDPRMELIEQLGTVPPSTQHQFLSPSRVVIKVRSHIIHLPVEHSPTIVLRTVLSHFLLCYATFLPLPSRKRHESHLGALDRELLASSYFGSGKLRNHKLICRWVFLVVLRLLIIVVVSCCEHVLQGFILDLSYLQFSSILVLFDLQ
jgi:hypothetical protein